MGKDQLTDSDRKFVEKLKINSKWDKILLTALFVFLVFNSIKMLSLCNYCQDPGTVSCLRDVVECRAMEMGKLGTYLIIYIFIVNYWGFAAKLRDIFQKLTD